MESSPKGWIQSSRDYLLDVRAEFRKVNWPSQREYVGGTIGILVIVAIITLYLGVMDLGLAQLMRLVLP